jgi:type IV pilus assembly protein PilA
MKPPLKLRLLTYLQSTRSTQGFTLIELLVVIVIVGILASIAMPNFINQAAKARQSEAKQNLGLVNRTQATYRNENNQFSSSFDALAVGGGLRGSSTANTERFTYKLPTSTDLRSTTTIIAYPTDTADRSYTGSNLIFTNSAGEIVSTSQICESKATGVGEPPDPPVQFTSTQINCLSDYRTLKDTALGN